MAQNDRGETQAKLYDLLTIREGLKETQGVEVRSGGGGGGSMEDVIRRVAALEKGQELIIGKLDGIAKGIADGRLENEKRFGAIESRLTGLETKLDTKASTADLRELSGKVSSIPNVWQTLAIMAGLLVGVGGLAFTISKLAGH